MSRIILLTWVGVLITSSGCTGLVCPSNSLVPSSKLPNVRSSCAIKLGNLLLEAIKFKNYSLIEDIPFSVGISSKLNNDNFIDSCNMLEQKLGQLNSFTYVTQLATPEVENHIWQVSFVEDKNNGSTIKRDLLFRLITGKINNKTTILSYGFL